MFGPTGDYCVICKEHVILAQILDTTGDPCVSCKKEVILLDFTSKWKEVHSRAFAVAEAKYPGVEGILVVKTRKDKVHGGFRAYCWWQDLKSEHKERFLDEYVIADMVNAAKRRDLDKLKEIQGTFEFEAICTEFSLGGHAFCTKSSPRLMRIEWLAELEV